MDCDSSSRKLTKVKVKWGKQIFPEIDLDPNEDPMVFRAQLYALTGVLPERQKIMIKGALLQSSWSNVKLSSGITVLLMGSKEEDVPQEPAVTPRFVEDMNDAELQSVANKLESGLTNLGNTCFVNATVQCLRSVPELRQALREYPEAMNPGAGRAVVPSQTLTAALRNLFATMDTAIHPVPPMMLIQVMQLLFPRFGEKMDNGAFVQQDANEFWAELVRILQQKLPSVVKDGYCTHTKSFIDQYFGGTMQVEWKCTESEDEPISVTDEPFLQLSCFISQEVKYLLAGLKSKMQEKITKFAPSLGRDAQFLRTSKLKRLPAYLNVQFVRFYYKEKESVNAKILKEVKFPLEFDVFELCSPELQAELTPMRQKFKEVEDFEATKASRTDSNKAEPSEDVAEQQFSFKYDLGSNNSGYYTLQAVLTHKGRSSTSGHYVAWVRESDQAWIKCDDEVLTRVPPEEVLKLCGGGDWHCAYVLLYGPKILRLPKELNIPPESNSDFSA